MAPNHKLIAAAAATVASLEDEGKPRIEYAKTAIEQLAQQAICAQCNGTIAVEISVQDGRLGKVKRLQIDFQPD
jgi:hypothetical protein